MQHAIAGRVMAKGASWSMKELQHAIRMKRRGAGYADIAVALGRRRDAVEAKLEFCSNGRTSRGSNIRASDDADLRGRSTAPAPPEP